MSYLDYLENYFDWKMVEYKNQARFHSPAALDPAFLKMVFRSGIKLSETQIGVRSIGAVTKELFFERLQPKLFGPQQNPAEMLLLAADYQHEKQVRQSSALVQFHLAHVVGINARECIFECSEIITLAKWGSDECPVDLVTLPPSRPVVPVISARQGKQLKGE